MCTTDITLWTYNTHLFGDLIGKLSGQGCHDSDRKHSIIQYFKSPPAGDTGLRLAAFQEIWDAGFAGDFAKDLKKHDAFANHFINDYHAIAALNRSGNALFGGPGTSFHDEEYFDYIRHCASPPPPFWAKQDLPTFKGYLKVRCEFTCSENHRHSLGFFGTHMPTNYGDYTESVTNCFQRLADKVVEFRSPKHHPDAAVLVAGDFNAAANSSKYTDLFEKVLLSGTGLEDSAAGQTVGNTIDGRANTLWQHFNEDKVEKGDYDEERLDYVLFANSGDGTMTVRVKSISVVLDNALTIPGDSLPLNDSDHYPLKVVLEVSVQS